MFFFSFLFFLFFKFSWSFLFCKLMHVCASKAVDPILSSAIQQLSKKSNRKSLSDGNIASWKKKKLQLFFYSLINYHDRGHPDLWAIVDPVFTPKTKGVGPRWPRCSGMVGLFQWYFHYSFDVTVNQGT